LYVEVRAALLRSGALTVLIGAVLMATALPAFAWKFPPRQRPAPPSMRTLIYPTTDGKREAMSLFTPARPDGPLPLILEVHGGGWEEGVRLKTLHSSLVASDLVHAGFMVASINYRLAPAWPWPDQIIDVASAVRYLRAHADALGIDPHRIGALGDSAGGQLVSLLGTEPATNGWSKGPNAAESSHVEAVVDEYGPTDLATDNWPALTAAMIRNTFGAEPTKGDAALEAASPISYVAPGDPPFLIVQGTADDIVPPSQSEDFAARLRHDGDSVSLLLVERGQHGLHTPGEVPGPSAIAQRITRFMVAKLH
jgi:acetyl esterase/lipase